MKAVLIDPFTQTVNDVNIGDDYKEINRQIGCDTFTVAGYVDDDCVYCDDEGLLKGRTSFTKIPDFAYPIAGRLLVLGSKPNGDSSDAFYDAADFLDMEGFQFLTHEEVVSKYV
jgi:hypothetical protein